MKKIISIIVLILIWHNTFSQIQLINKGVTPNDGTGDGLRTVATKVNANFLYHQSRIDSVELNADAAAERLDSLLDAGIDTDIAWGDISGTLSSQTDLNTALSGKTPTTRTLTINGTAYDLSADRSWIISGGVWGQITGTLSNQTDLNTALSGKQDALVSGTNIKTVNSTSLLGSGNVSVGTVTSIATSAPITGGTITGTGTIGISQATTSTNGYLSSTDWNTFNGKVSLSGTETLTNKRISPRVQSVTSSATVTPNADSDDAVKITAQAAGLTLANPSGTPTAMQAMIIRIKDNGTARSITFGNQYRAVGVTLPTATVIFKTLYLGIIWNADDSKWDVIGYSLEQ